MVEQVQNLDQNRIPDHDHVHYHQHHRKNLIFFQLNFIDFLIVVVQLPHQNGMVNQVIVYMYHRLIHVHLDVILRKSLQNLVQ